MNRFDRDRRQRAIDFYFGNQDTSSGPGPYVRNAFPAYRVFLFGFEITEDVTSITIQNHIGKAPNTCVISVLNERDKYILTHEDMLFLLDADPSQLRRPSRNLEIAAEDIEFRRLVEDLADPRSRFEGILSETGIPLDDDYSLANPNGLKSRIFKLKQQHVPIDVDVINENGEVIGREPRNRWAFAEGLSVFHPNDPLRVFVRDIFDPRVWFYGFSGLVTDVTDDVSKDNMKTLSISSEDPTKLLRYARITANPGINDASILTADDEAEITGNSNPLQDKTLVQIFDFLIFGSHRELPPAPDVPVETAREFRPDPVNPSFRRVVSESEEQLRSRIIRSGLIGTDILPGDDLTPDQQRALDAAVDRTRERAVTRAEAEDKFFSVDVINQYGETVQRRFGLTGTGSFKPAQDRVGGVLAKLAASGAATLPGLTTDEQAALASGASLSELNSVSQEDFEKSDAALRAAVTEAASGPFVLSLGSDPTAPDGQEATPISLEQWDSIVSWRVQNADLSTLLSKDVPEAIYRERLRKRHATVTSIEDVITLIGTDPVHFPVDGGRVFMFLPIGAGATGREVVGQQLIGSFAVKTGEFQNRLALCYQALDRIEFIFYCTPKGDLVVEFPLYDFDPNDFGALRESSYVVESADLFSVSSTVSDASVKTIAKVDVSLFNMTDTNNDARNALHTIVVKNPAMFPVYGTRQEVGNREGLIQTDQAARLYCNILLNRLNADAHSVSLPIIPRFDIGLNRPILWKYRNHIGTTVSVVHNLAWNGSWRTTLNVNHMRGWVGQRATAAETLFQQGPGRIVANEMVYVPVGGGAASRPINYKVLFQRNGPQQGQDINTGERSSGSTPSQQQPAASGGA